MEGLEPPPAPVGASLFRSPDSGVGTAWVCSRERHLRLQVLNLDVRVKNLCRVAPWRAPASV